MLTTRKDDLPSILLHYLPLGKTTVANEKSYSHNDFMKLEVKHQKSVSVDGKSW